MEQKEKKPAVKMPHTFVLISIIIIVMSILTYVIPAGVYERYRDERTGRTLVAPGTFQYVEPTPVRPFDVVKAIPAGMEEVAWIAFLILIIGGSFGIINSTGAIEAGINHTIVSLKDNDLFIIPVAMTLFSIGGATIGMSESTLMFVPIGVSLAKGLGYDRITGMAIVNIGAVIGFAGGALNIFTVGVAQGIADLPLFSGLGFRVIGHIILLSIAVAYVMSYSRKIKKDPTLSLVYEEEMSEAQEERQEKIEKMTTTHKLVLLIMVLGFSSIVYGIISGWSTSRELSSVFLIMGVTSGFLARKSPNAIAVSFLEGAKAVVFGALVVGLSRAILVVMTQGQIIDTIIHTSSSKLSMFPVAVSAVMMFFLQVVINFIVNSGSGQAATTMPIMIPLADGLGITRQTAVVAFQYGDGLSNAMYPTSGTFMAAISIAKIPYDKWLRWVTPLMLMLHAAAAALVMIAAVIELGPF